MMLNKTVKLFLANVQQRSKHIVVIQHIMANTQKQPKYPTPMQVIFQIKKYCFFDNRKYAIIWLFKKEVCSYLRKRTAMNTCTQLCGYCIQLIGVGGYQEQGHKTHRYTITEHSYYIHIFLEFIFSLSGSLIKTLCHCPFL